MLKVVDIIPPSGRDGVGLTGVRAFPRDRCQDLRGEGPVANGALGIVGRAREASDDSDNGDGSIGQALGVEEVFGRHSGKEPWLRLAPNRI